jgi:Raf kinase inhibitor-like YbhB/YbcL family protein
MRPAMRAAYISNVRRSACVLLGCLVLAGCGGDDGGGRTGTSRGTIVVTSPDFKAGGAIPARFTCAGSDVSPELNWRHVPKGTTQFTVSVVDSDAKGFVHWKLGGLPPRATGVIGGPVVPPRAREGRNSFGKSGYDGPCPPPGDPPHDYVFTVTALGAGGKVLDHGSLVGTFKR